MATDFYQRQADARRSTKWLVVMFVLAVIGIVGTTMLATAILIATTQPQPDSRGENFVNHPDQWQLVVIAGVAALIGNIFRSGVVAGIMALIISLIGYAIWTFMVVIIGTKLMPEPTTKADFQEGFRVIGFTAAPGVFNVLAIIPFLGPLISFFISLWTLVIGVIAVREVLDYSNTGRAIVVCLIAFVIYLCVVFFILTPLLLARAVLG